MAMSLKEKMAAKKAAEAAAAGRKDGPAAPKLGSTMSEPPQGEVAAPVPEEPKRKSVPPPAPQPEAREETPVPSEPPAAAPTPAPSPIKVVAPAKLRPVTAPKGAKPPQLPDEAAPETTPAGPVARSKATAPFGTAAPVLGHEEERESTPGEEVSTGDLEISSGDSALPASLKSLDLSALDDAPAEEKKDEKKEEKRESKPKPAPAPRKAASPPANPKIQRRQRNFVEGEEQQLSQGFALEHVESAGVAAAKFVLSGHGVRKEVVLTRQKPASMKFDTDDGEYSVNLLYKENNEEGAMVVHSEIAGESQTDKAKEKAAKAAKAAGSAVSNLRHFVPEMISAAFIPAWSVVLATRDWFKQFSESHASWPMVGVYAAIAIQVALTVWSGVSRYRKLNGKEE